MNLKKYIKLKDDAPQKVTRNEKEQELYDSFLQRVEQNAAEKAVAKKRVNLWKILTPVLSVASALVITLTCVFTLRGTNEFMYNEDKILSRETTFEEFKLDANFFDLKEIESILEQVLIFYDSESEDKLYYSILANVELSKVELVVVINEKYNYNFEVKEDITTKQLTDYVVYYRSESSRGNPQIDYKGWIKVNTETVYFDYVQSPALGDEAFFESIQQIIKVKK